MNKKHSNIILLGMIGGAIVGVIGGYFLPDTFLAIDFLGTLFLNALKMVVVPLIVASMVVGVTGLGDIRKLGPTAAKTMLYYLITTGISVVIGIVLVNLFVPGEGIDSFGAVVPDMVAEAQGKTLKDVLIGLLPTNIIQAAAQTDILPLIVFSLLFGGVLTAIGKRGDPVVAVFEGINEAMMRIVHLIIYFAPVGVMSLIGAIVAEKRGDLEHLFSSLGMYSLTVIVGLITHAFIVLPLILKLRTGRSPWKYARNMGEALTTAFTTASSSATLPVTMEAVEERNEVDSRASSFVLPLGATINMDGTAMYEAVAAIFIAQVYGVDLTIGQQMVIFLTATLASIGAAGIPHAGTVMMVGVLAAVKLPMEGIGLIFAVDWFLDRCRTTVNVWGDSVGAAVIAETKEFRNN